MKHVTACLLMKSAAWSSNPPTGVAVAREFGSIFAEEDYVADLARLSGRSEHYVRWQLMLDTVVPACLLTAALRFRKQRFAGSGTAVSTGLSPTITQAA